MKTCLLNRLWMGALALVLAASCSHPGDYTNAIPAEATEVVSIDLQSLALKAGVDDPQNAEALQKLSQTLASGVSADAQKAVETFFDNPSEAGIDFGKPVYIFHSSETNRQGFIAAVDDTDKLKNLLKATQSETQMADVAEKDGYNYCYNDRAFVAFNATTLLVLPTTDTPDIAQLHQEVAALLGQKAEQSVHSQQAFRQMQETQGDVRMMMTASTFLQFYPDPMLKSMMDSLHMQNIQYIGGLSFEPGRMAINASYTSDDPQAQAFIEKQLKTTRPLQNTFASYFPQSTLFYLTLGMDGKEVFAQLDENPQLKKALSDKDRELVKTLVASLENDFTLGITGLNAQGNPTILAYAETNNTDLPAVRSDQGTGRQRPHQAGQRRLPVHGQRHEGIHGHARQAARHDQRRSPLPQRWQGKQALPARHGLCQGNRRTTLGHRRQYRSRLQPAHRQDGHGLPQPPIPRHGDCRRKHLLPGDEQRGHEGPRRAATEGPKDQCAETDCRPGEGIVQPVTKEQPTFHPMKEIHLQQTLPQIFAGRDAIASEVWHRDLTFERGKQYLVEAASGTGKSSLCSYLYGYRNDYEGIICFDGSNIRSLKAADWTRLHRRSLSILFQELRLFSELTALENVLLKNQLTRFKSRREIDALFDALGIGDKKNEPTGRLSFGQQQRVAFIRCLCQPMDFILLDEPVSHLDEANAAVMASLLDKEAGTQGAGVIVTSIGKHLNMDYNNVLKL